MKKTSTFLALLLFVLIATITANGQVMISGRALHIPSATHTTRLNNVMLMDNPALADFRGVSASVVPSRFGISELTSGQFVAGEVLSEDIGGAAMISGLGNDIYNEFSGTATVAYHVTEDFTLGTSLQYAQLAIRDAETLRALQLHIGLFTQLSEQVSAGFVVENVNRGYYDGGEETVEQRALIGVGIELLPQLHADVGAVVLLNRASAMSVALSYDIFNSFRVRAAAQSFPQTGELGIAFDVNEQFNISALAQYHLNLGLSQAVVVGLRW
jgi:hypothetical protein